MKSAYWGWEANSMQNEQVLSVVPVTKSIIIRSFILDLSACLFEEPPIFGAAPYSISLFSAYITNKKPTGLYTFPQALEFGVPSFTSLSGKETTANGDLMYNGLVGADMLCSSMLVFQKDPATGVNKTIVSPQGLDIPVPAGSFIVSQSSQNGIKTNFVGQFTMFYDNNEA